MRERSLHLGSRMKSTKDRKKVRLVLVPPTEVTLPVRHVPFDDEELPDVLEHGERSMSAPREESLLGTPSSHAPPADTRAAEPFDEISTSSVDAALAE